MSKMTLEVSADLKQRINVVLYDIYDSISELTAIEDSLLTGNLGLVIYHYYITQSLIPTDSGLKVVKLIEDIIENVIDEKSSLKTFQYSNGLAGLGSVMQFLVNENVIDFDLNDDFKTLDEFIFESALKQINKGYVEFLHGGCGVLYYFGFRDQSAVIDHYIDTLVAAVLDQIKMDPLGIRIPRGQFSWTLNDDFDLGFSHGLCGVMHVLLFILEKDRTKESSRIRSYLNDAVNFIIGLKRKIKAESGILSIFPSYLGKDIPAEAINDIEYWENSRLAWCYGDIGWVLFIYKYGYNSNNNYLINIADQIGISTTLRQNLFETNSDTSHFCHGHAGLAQIYRKLFIISGKVEYHEAYLFWITRILDDLEIELPGGYYNRDGMLTSFLEGLAGVSLVLNSCAVNDDSLWEKFFLI